MWEGAIARTDGDRAGVLLQLMDDESAPVATLGEQNARLLELHTRLFGSRAELLSRCPSCGNTAQFAVDCAELRSQLPSPPDACENQLTLAQFDVRFRLPGPADVLAASDHDDESFVRRLIERCVISCSANGQAVPVGAWPESLIVALSDRIEALDPAASVSFALQCPQCAGTWQAPLDCADLLWQKVQAAAERLLIDVDALARTYGWTESEVLELSPTRRAAYVQLITS